MRTMISIVAVWRPTMRTTDESQATVTLDSVKQQDQTVSASLQLRLVFRLPDQDEHLPGAIEAYVHRAGLEAQRALFRALIEHADRQLVLAARAGKDGQGVQLRGTRPFHFKTVFGTPRSSGFESPTAPTARARRRPLRRGGRATVAR